MHFLGFEVCSRILVSKRLAQGSKHVYFSLINVYLLHMQNVPYKSMSNIVLSAFSCYLVFCV